MCAEFTYGPPAELDRLLEALQVIRNVLFEESYGRVFPRGKAPIILKNEKSEFELMPAEFSLIPPWWNPEKAEKKSKSGRPPFATHNARLETIDQKPAFKDSFKKRPCLVPIYEFFESSVFGEKFAGHRIKFSAGHVLLAAGCYSVWLDKSTGELVYSFTIITHLPSRQIFECGHDRMPVFLNLDQAKLWLGLQDKEFLLKNQKDQKNVKERQIQFQVTVDRVLKDGWQKNAPDDSELQELFQQIS